MAMDEVNEGSLVAKRVFDNIWFDDNEKGNELQLFRLLIIG